MPKLSRGREEKLRRALRERGGQIPPDAARLANALWDGEDAGPVHDECIASLPAYVRAEADGLPVSRLHPGTKRHLDRCESCGAQYVDMLEVALADAADTLPQPDFVPAPDLSFLDARLAASRVAVQKWAGQILTTLSPQAIPGFQDLAEVFFEQVGALEGEFSLQALAVRGQEPGMAMAVLALTYAATESLASSFTPRQLDEESRTGTLEQTVKARALSVAEEITLDPKTASRLAGEFAAQVAKDPAALRALVQ